MKTQLTLATHFKLFIFIILSLINSNLYAQECSKYLRPQYHQQIALLTSDYREVVNQRLVPPGSWAADLTYLAVNNMLIPQNHPKLAYRNLLAEGGGLCGPTCVAYVAASQDFHTSQRRSSYWVTNLDIIIDSLIRNYQEIALVNDHPSGEDPRMGTQLDFFTEEFNPKTREFGVVAKTVPELTIENLNNVLNQQNGLVIGTAQLIVKRDSVFIAHAIVILSINTLDQLITILDPNFPSKILITSYSTYEGKIYFALNKDAYGDSGLNQVYLTRATSFTILK
jgi:hypothetical protein